MSTRRLALLSKLIVVFIFSLLSSVACNIALPTMPVQPTQDPNLIRTYVAEAVMTLQAQLEASKPTEAPPPASTVAPTEPPLILPTETPLPPPPTETPLPPAPTETPLPPPPEETQPPAPSDETQPPAPPEETELPPPPSTPDQPQPPPEQPQPAPEDNPQTEAEVVCPSPDQSACPPPEGAPCPTAPDCPPCSEADCPKPPEDKYPPPAAYHPKDDDGAPKIIPEMNTNCRTGTSTLYPVVGYFLEGDVSYVYGRLRDNSWWYIRNPSKSSGYCWVWGETTCVLGDYRHVPVMTPPPLCAKDHYYSYGFCHRYPSYCNRYYNECHPPYCGPDDKDCYPQHCDPDDEDCHPQHCDPDDDDCYPQHCDPDDEDCYPQHCDPDDDDCYPQHCDPDDEDCYPQHCDPDDEDCYPQHCDPDDEDCYPQHCDPDDEVCYPQHGKGFSAGAVNIHTCKGENTVFFRVHNNGSSTLESGWLRINDQTSGKTLFGPWSSNNPFRSSDKDCSADVDNLKSGNTLYIAGDVNPKNLHKHHLEARIQLCTEEGLGGSCYTQTVSFVYP